jgi:patatin-like phospholipase/acyl hydrolase
MSKFNILSIDGGGLRGIVPLRILQELERRTGKRVHQLFDMMAGTSTGGLIASCLSLRKEPGSFDPLYSPDALSKLYTDYGSTIFPPSGSIGKFFKKINNLYNPAFDDKGIDKVLKMFIADQRINDAIMPLLISTYNLNGNQPVFFKSSEAHTDPTANALIYDICRATSAAPTYLPSYSFPYKGQMLTGIDGGVYVNNPAMASLAELSKWGKSGFYKKRDGSTSIEMADVCVVSLGTGSYTGSITQQQAVGWGQLDWVTRITDIMMKGVNQTTHYESNEVLYDGQYIRLDMAIGEEKYADMTDSSESTRNYLLTEVDKQVCQTPLMDKLVDFVTKHT